MNEGYQPLYDKSTESVPPQSGTGEISTDQLTKREQIALAMVQGNSDLVRYGHINSAQVRQMKENMLLDAFAFADFFLSISEGTAGKSVSEMENTDDRR